MTNQTHSDIQRREIPCSRKGHRTPPRRRKVNTWRGRRMRGSTGSAHRRRMMARTGRDRVQPETARLDRMSLTPALARDPGHMTSPAARLRMRSRHTIFGSRRRPIACLQSTNNERLY